MKERSISPRLRPGEIIPPVPEGFDLTRLDGDLVWVSARENGESYVGGSPYTERQLRQLDGIRNYKRMLIVEQEETVQIAENIIYVAYLQEINNK